jgi:hypothetical protein
VGARMTDNFKCRQPHESGLRVMVGIVGSCRDIPAQSACWLHPDQFQDSLAERL